MVQRHTSSQKNIRTFVSFCHPYFFHPPLFPQVAVLDSSTAAQNCGFFTLRVLFPRSQHEGNCHTCLVMAVHNLGLQKRQKRLAASSFLSAVPWIKLRLLHPVLCSLSGLPKPVWHPPEEAHQWWRIPMQGLQPATIMQMANAMKMFCHVMSDTLLANYGAALKFTLSPERMSPVYSKQDLYLRVS